MNQTDFLKLVSREIFQTDFLKLVSREIFQLKSKINTPALYLEIITCTMIE